MLRLGAELYREAALDSLLVDLGFRGCRRWTVRGFSPKSLDYLFGEAQHVIEEDEVRLDRPLRLGRDEVMGEPDWCAYRVLRRLFEWFGFSEEAVPSEFDRVTRRFVLAGP